jgi:protein-disulfide isomerase
VVYSNEFREMIDEFIEKDIFVAECILGEESEHYLKENLKDFETFGMKGTPTFIIGRNIFSGYKDYPEFKKIVESQLTTDNYNNS